MTKESKETAMAVHEREALSHGSPTKHEPGLDNETSDVMKPPHDAGEHKMGGVHKGSDAHIGNSGMGHAVKQLEYETERGGHAPAVGGHKGAGHQHSGKLCKE